MTYSFNNYLLDTENFKLSLNGKLIEVEPRVFDLIVYLIKQKGKVVTRDELFEMVWHGREVLDATLSNHIKSARNVLGDDGQSQKVIKTIHGRGYQFIAECQIVTHELNTDEKPAAKLPGKYLPYLFLSIVAVLIFIFSNSSHQKNKIARDEHKKSIAVLAFLDMSPQKDHEYFSDGISEEILNKLTHVTDLRVISRTSSFYFKDKELTISEIGKQLNVSHVLEGSVRKQNNKVRITVQLIDTKTSNHLWSETYDKTMNDIFQIQDDIAMAVSKKLKLSLLPKTSKPVKVNKDAYSEYLKAKFFSQTNTRENNVKSELAIKKSIAFDPNFAPAWQFLANNVFVLHYDSGLRSVKTRTKIALFAIKKAIELDQNFAPAYAILARVQSQNLQFEKSDQNMQKALSLDKNNSYILDIAALNAMYSGDIDRALNFRAKIKDINPKYFRNIYNIGLLDFTALKLDSAIESFKLFIQHKPENAMTHHMLSSVYMMQGNNKLALEYANKEKDGFWKDYIMCMALFAAGKIKQADELLENFLIERHYSRVNIARIYASRGEIEKSFEWLLKASDRMDSNLIAWLPYPEFRKMHNDKRWHQIVRKMKFPTSHWLMQKLPQ